MIVSCWSNFVSVLTLLFGTTLLLLLQHTISYRQFYVGARGSRNLEETFLLCRFSEKLKIEAGIKKSWDRFRSSCMWHNIWLLRLVQPIGWKQLNKFHFVLFNILLKLLVHTAEQGRVERKRKLIEKLLRADKTFHFVGKLVNYYLLCKITDVSFPHFGSWSFFLLSWRTVAQPEKAEKVADVDRRNILVCEIWSLHFIILSASCNSL